MMMMIIMVMMIYLNFSVTFFLDSLIYWSVPFVFLFLSATGVCSSLHVSVGCQRIAISFI